MTSMPVLESRHRTIGASCYQYHRVQPGVHTLMALSRYRDALVQQAGPERPLVYQPLVPQILAACYQVVLLPRDFDAWPPAARDVLLYAVALFLSHSDALVWTRKPPLPSSLLTSGLMVTSATLELKSYCLTPQDCRRTFNKSGFIGQDEAGHGRSTVGLTRARGTTISRIRTAWLVSCKQPVPLLHCPHL